MATTMTDEEKKEYIKKIVDEGKKNRFFSVADISRTFTDLTESQLRSAVEKYFGMKALEYFTGQGVLMSAEDMIDTIIRDTRELMLRYDGKRRPVTLSQLYGENPDFDFGKFNVYLKAAVKLRNLPYGYIGNEELLRSVGLLLSGKERRVWADEVIGNFKKEKGKSLPYANEITLIDAFGRDYYDALAREYYEEIDSSVNDREKATKVYVMLGLLKDPDKKAEPIKAVKDEKKKTPPAENHSGNWYLSAKMQKSLQQVTVCLSESKKSYNYLSRYPVAVGNKVIVGYTLAVSDYDTKKGATTGLFGTVEKIADKKTLKNWDAVELDFVFSESPSKSGLKQCMDYLDNKDYYQTLQFGKSTSPVRPINHFIRRILSALSVLSNASLVAVNDIEKAKEAIKSVPEIEEQIFDLYYESWNPAIELIQHYVDGIDCKPELQAVSGDLFTNTIHADSINQQAVRENMNSDGVRKYIEKYTYLGALSILARGGFYNLLKAYVSAESPLQKHAAEMLKLNVCTGVMAKCLEYAATGTEPADLRKIMMGD